MKNIICENCGWEGTREELQEVWAANPLSPNDEYLRIQHECPKCGSIKVSEKIEKEVDSNK